MTAHASTRGRDLVDPALLARLERLQISTRRPLAGHFSGEHRSNRFGSSLDFADYREYHPGDDFRRIDYHLYARLGVLLIKLFDAEDDLTVRLLIDTSASMATGTKLLQAKRLAAALGFVALVRRDAVALYTFPFERPPLRFSGRGAAGDLFDRLASLEAEGETRFADAVGHLLGRGGPAGITIVVSDLLTAEWERGLDRLPARGSEISILHVLDRAELAPSLIGDLDLVDRETGERVTVSLTAESLVDFERAATGWADDVAARARRSGASYLRVFDDEPIEPLLLGAARTAGVVR